MLTIAHASPNCCEPHTELHLALWLESAAILAFGVAWLTKGEAILGDLG